MINQTKKAETPKFESIIEESDCKWLRSQSRSDKQCYQVLLLGAKETNLNPTKLAN